MWWVYKAPPSVQYRSFSIKKRAGGEREIKAPAKPLRDMQVQLALALQAHYQPLICVHGYVSKRSIVSNAEAHCNRRWVFNVDLLDFFGTITFPRILGLFQHGLGLRQSVAAPLAHLATGGQSLPQGAPSSPILSNMVCFRMDKQLMALARKQRCTYTRYSDDLTFSSRAKDAPRSIVDIGSKAIGPVFDTIVRNNGFVPNPKKSWFRVHSQGMTVTGLNVDKTPSVPSRVRRRVRAILHDVATNGVDDAEARHIKLFGKPSRAPFRRQGKLHHVVRGMISYVSMVHGKNSWIVQEMLHDYRAAFHTLQGSPGQLLNERKRFDAFLCHSSEDKRTHVSPLAEELSQQNVSCWYDDQQIAPGEELTARINDGLRRSSKIVVLVSRSWFSSPWAKRETSSALRSEIEQETSRVVCVIVGGDYVKQKLTNEMPLLAEKRYILWSDAAQVASDVKGFL